ncbi:MAG: isoaspartyl peptidase/L-asparaginase, partial [Actinomycetota bacterium]
LEHTPHVFLGWRGAMALASPDDLLLETTPDQQSRWTRAHRAGNLDPAGYAYAEADTVGTVGLDSEGRLSAGSSTGGVFGKMPGRVGDTPIFGAGFYASEQVAVVGTGIGELFIETLGCLRVAQLVEGGRDPQGACDDVIGLLGARRKLPAALLALDGEGRIGAACQGGSFSVEGPDGPVEPVSFDGET